MRFLEGCVTPIAIMGIGITLAAATCPPGPIQNGGMLTGVGILLFLLCVVPLCIWLDKRNRKDGP
ncbi:MAG: hypothetical protein U0136_13200 [Bdellovibrionota bacterium]